MLVDFFDELIKILEEGIYPGFLLDGQVSPVFDYLEIRPEMAERVKKLVRAGKLQIGPWLVLPDEYPVDGEALVRNLLYGIRKCQELGGVFNVGYTSFGWGQTSQLPQIYRGFGMDVAMIGKRVSKERAPQCEFIWKGPDGSKLLATRFGEWGRQNFYFKIHLSSLFGTYHEGDGWKYIWPGWGIAFHRADREQMEQDHSIIGEPETWHPETITAELMDETWRTMDESVLGNDRLMMNGCDYTAVQKLFPEMVKHLNEMDKNSDRQWIHTTMPAYIETMRTKIDLSKLNVVTGELRDGPSPALTGNALSTRLYLKQLNKRAQNALIRFAEPLMMLANMVGAPFEKVFAEKAWNFLLEAHPHDSINGVTQDKTALDTSNRLEQVLDLANSLGNRAMQEIIKRIDTSVFNKNDVLLVVFNPLPYARKEIVEAWVNMPEDVGPKRFGDCNVHGIELFDGDGKSVGVQWQGSTDEVYCVAELHTRAFPFSCQRHRIFFDAGIIPAGGYKLFKTIKARGGVETASIYSDSLSRTGSLLKAPNIMENDLLRVEFNPNGTFNLTHKGLCRSWLNLNYYEDRGECGDYWVNNRLMFDQAHNSLGCYARIWSEEAGPLMASIVSEIRMQLPAKTLDCNKRSEETRELKILTKVVLYANSEDVEVEVNFDNRIGDHYLKAMFPIGLPAAQNADAGGHFIVDSRPIKPQGPCQTRVWPDMGTLPQNNFVDVSDGKVGFAILNEGFTEYEVIDSNKRVLALSLLRSVRNWICTEIRAGSSFPSQKGGQCFGPHKFRYSIRPHKGNWYDANIPLAAELFNINVKPVQTSQHCGTLPSKQASFFEITNTSVRFSALKKALDRDTYIVRIYNPGGRNEKTELKFQIGCVSKAWLTDLNEKRLTELTVSSQLLEVYLRPYEIVTVEIEKAEGGRSRA